MDRFQTIIQSQIHVKHFQENHYYPYGMVMADIGSTFPAGDLEEPYQPYLYKSKEYNPELGLEWYDYGARFYDPALGRFTTIDPLAEQFPFQSPYLYGYNNPIRFIDYMGMNGDEPDKEQETKIKSPNVSEILSGVLTQLGLNKKSPESSTDEKLEATVEHNKQQAETRKILKEAGKETLKEGARHTQTAGALINTAGYALIPITAGLSLELVPIGTTIEAFGIGTEITLDAIDGKFDDVPSAVIQIGASILSSKIKALQFAKNDKIILQFVNDMGARTTTAITDMAVKKMNEDIEKDK
ncbi:MAG: RHS repeat-associated core domain-containing protein [Prolixibacteraceae bacterium]|nr:RHS repeat-associated core domain-containing protein [Prolixibacteraceae bacterium]